MQNEIAEVSAQLNDLMRKMHTISSEIVEKRGLRNKRTRVLLNQDLASVKAQLKQKRVDLSELEQVPPHR